METVVWRQYDGNAFIHPDVDILICLWLIFQKDMHEILFISLTFCWLLFWGPMFQGIFWRLPGRSREVLVSPALFTHALLIKRDFRLQRKNFFLAHLHCWWFCFQQNIIQIRVTTDCGLRSVIRVIRFLASLKIKFF